MVLLASDFDKSRFLKAADLKTEKKFRIKNVWAETVGVGDEKERKPVLWFTNDERGLLLNTTNLRALAGAFGDSMEGWVGKVIVVFPTMIDFRGKMVPALRVRIPPPKQASGNGQAQAGNGSTPAKPTVVEPVAAATPAATPAPKPEPMVEVDPELADDPKPTLAADMDDEIPF
jgi:hypothetical protein